MVCYDSYTLYYSVCGTIQAHVPLQRLRTVQVETVRPPSGTHQSPEPAPLRLHPLQRHQHLHLRLHPLRKNSYAQSYIQIISCEILQTFSSL